MEYNKLNDLKNAFVQGMTSLAEEIVVDGVHYRYRDSNTVEFASLFEGELGLVQYTVRRNPENMERWNQLGSHTADDPGMHEWIIFAWKSHGLSVYPFGVKSTIRGATIARDRLNTEGEELTEADTAVSPAQQSAAQKKDEEWKARVVGKTAQISFPQFSRAKSVQGKVDTGANISSIHAEDIQVDKDTGTVRCRIPALGGDNMIRMKVSTQQAVKSADGGTEYRPVVLLNVNINGKVLDGMEFNLNDRSKMNNDILIGHNILEKAKLMVDPTMEDVEPDWKELEKLFEDEVLEFQADESKDEKTMSVAEVYDLITNNNISLDELFEQARTAGVEAAEAIES